MGAFQSKVWEEVASSGSPGSPSENQPLSNNGKPVAPFRDPRSISDGVERTPIQIAAEKRLKKSSSANEAAKDNVMPAVDQTPTGPSFAGRFMDLLESTSKMEIAATTKGKLLAANEFVSAEDENEKNGDKDNDMIVHDQQQKPLTEVPAKDTTTLSQGNSTLESDCRSPLLIENDDSAMKMSLRPGGGILTPNNARCGKKPMFPMTFGYQEAKSPRSPLGTVSLNTNFVPSPAVQNIQKIKPQRLSMGNKIGEHSPNQENDYGENRSLVI